MVNMASVAFYQMISTKASLKVLLVHSKSWRNERKIVKQQEMLWIVPKPPEGSNVRKNGS